MTKSHTTLADQTRKSAYTVVNCPAESGWIILHIGDSYWVEAARHSWNTDEQARAKAKMFGVPVELDAEYPGAVSKEWVLAHYKRSDDSIAHVTPFGAAVVDKSGVLLGTVMYQHLDS